LLWTLVKRTWSELDTRLSKWPFLYYVLPPLAWMLLIYYLSNQPSLPQAHDPLVDVLLKKGAHMAEYAILLVLWWRAAARHFRQVPSDGFGHVSALAIAWILTVLYAVSDEVHQTFVPGRNGRVLDVLIDAGGASLAFFTLWVGARSSNRHLR
jgi:VanZ family protein